MDLDDLKIVSREQYLVYTALQKGIRIKEASPSQIVQALFAFGENEKGYEIALSTEDISLLRDLSSNLFGWSMGKPVPDDISRRAREKLEKLVETPDEQRNVASVFHMRKDYENAFQFYQKSGDKQKMAKVLVEMGKHEEAREMYKELANEEGNSSKKHDYLINAAKSARALKDFQEAIRLYREADCWHPIFQIAGKDIGDQSLVDKLFKERVGAKELKNNFDYRGIIMEVREARESGNPLTTDSDLNENFFYSWIKSTINHEKKDHEYWYLGDCYEECPTLNQTIAIKLEDVEEEAGKAKAYSAAQEARKEKEACYSRLKKHESRNGLTKLIRSMTHLPK